MRRVALWVVASTQLHHLSRLLYVVSALAALQVIVFLYYYSSVRHSDRPKFLRSELSPPSDESTPGQEVPRPSAIGRQSPMISSKGLLPSTWDIRRTQHGSNPVGINIDFSKDLISELARSFTNCSSSSSMTSFMMYHPRRVTKCLQRPRKHSEKVLYRSENGLKCLVEGTRNISEGRCYCKNDWQGESCSVPSEVTNSNYPIEYGLKLRDYPARIVYGFPFSHEFDLTELRLEEYGDLVDVYVIVESNYTASGLPKPWLLRDRLRQTDYLRKYRSKLVLAELDWFPTEAYNNGWIVDELLRTFIVSNGLARVRGLRDDDVFVLTDADEIPSRTSLQFLKFHFGYPEPVGFHLRHNVFSSHWISPHSPLSNVFGACSFGMLRYLFNSNPYYLRRASRHLANNAKEVEYFRYRRGGRVNEWSFGSGESRDMQAGTHCSWCFDVPGILFKMTSAHLSDVPRWGNVGNYVDFEYVSSLVERGMWFDNITALLPASKDKQEN